MRKITRERKNMRDELSQRFFQLSRQRNMNKAMYKMWGDVAYLNKFHTIDETMQSICDEFKRLDEIEYRDKILYNQQYRAARHKVWLTNGYVNVRIPEKDVEDYISYYPDFWRGKCHKNMTGEEKLLQCALQDELQ
jgi:hypothetical protein